MRRSSLRWLLPACLIYLFGCAHDIDMKTSMPVPQDGLEMFRRARFAEVMQLPDVERSELMKRLREGGTTGVSETEALAWSAYRLGKGQVALEAASLLPKKHSARKVLTSLLSHVDIDRPLRESISPSNSFQFQLDRDALNEGYPIIEAVVDGKRLRVLWDTGATENVLDFRAAGALDWGQEKTRFGVDLGRRTLVVRFSTAGSRSLTIEESKARSWQLKNIPWMIRDLAPIAGDFRVGNEVIDGILSPQLLLPGGCFVIDRIQSRLYVALRKSECGQVIADAKERSSLFPWDGEIFASGRVGDSPELGFRLETGSPITYLRTGATRYLPSDALATAFSEAEGIASELETPAVVHVAGRSKPIKLIELVSVRPSLAHDDIASLGNDIILDRAGVVVSFATMEMGFLKSGARAASMTAKSNNRL